MVLKEKHVADVRTAFMDRIVIHVTVIQMVLIQTKIQNVVPILVIVNVGMAMKETNVIDVKEIIISQTLSVLFVVAM